MKFRKKPVVIDAVQWSVNIESESEIESMGCVFEVRPDNPDYLIIQTLEGAMQASPWDWIIKGVKGEFYPCKPDIFEATHEAVELEREEYRECSVDCTRWTGDIGYSPTCQDSMKALAASTERPEEDSQKTPSAQGKE